MIQPQSSHILAMILVGVFLIILGSFYDRIIGWVEKHHLIEGYTWLTVVVGVLFTLGGVAIIDWQAALLAGAGFACSGTPMIIGALHRHAIARLKEREYERQTAGVAKPGEGS